jgi:hypothetical protein
MKTITATLAAAALTTLSVLPSAVLAHSTDDPNEQTFETKRVPVKLPNTTAGFEPSAVEGVVDEFRLWQTGSTLTACFFGGSQQLRKYFVESSEDIFENTNLKLNYGKEPSYNECGEGAYHIRIAFDPKNGNWSYIGTDSIRIASNKPSLNIGYGSDSDFSLVNKAHLKGVILHELGHAIALQHEHQSPEAKCDTEFDWNKIYATFKSNYNWSKDKVDTNLRQLTASPRLRTTDYDKKSIMHYYFAPWMFTKGDKSRCYTNENLKLSSVDKETIEASYPESATAQINLIKERSNFAGTVLKKILTTDEQIAWAKDLIDQAASTASPGFSIDINTAINNSTNNSSQDVNSGQCADAQIHVSTGDQSPVVVCKQ